MKLKLRKYFHLKSKKLSGKSKIITLVIIVLLAVSALLIVNQEVIHHRLYQALGKTLSEWVNKETSGLYRLEYDSIRINTLREQISLRNVRLELDSNKIATVEGFPNNLYEAKAPELFLDIRSIWNFLLEDKLEFIGIRARNPEFYIYNTVKKDSSNTLSLQSGDLYLKINRYLDEFDINDFEIINGKIIYKKLDVDNEFVVENLDATVRNLVLNATEKTTETDRVFVILKKPSYFLADGLHKINMDSIILDSDEKSILLKKVSVYPDFTQLQNVDVDEVNIYNFEIPEILLKGIDFKAAYNDNILDIEKILIPAPEIIIDTHKGSRGDRKRDNNLVKQLSHLFNRIKTSEFSIEEGKIDLALEANGRMRNIMVENTSININDLDLDTLKYSKQNSHINFSTFDLELKDYQLNLPDSVHQLTVESINYWSDSSLLAINEVNISPVDSNYSTFNRIKAYSPYLRLKGFDAKKYLQEHDLSLTEIEISNPYLTLYNYKPTDSARQVLLNFIFPENKLAAEISSQAISISSFDFDLFKDRERITGFSNGWINLQNFLISNSYPEDSTKFFNSENVSFGFPELAFSTKNKDQVILRGVNGDLTNSTFHADNLNYITARESFDFNGADIKISGFDVRDALYGRIIQLDTLLIKELNVDRNPNNKRSVKRQNQIDMPVLIRYLNVADGHLQVIDDKINATIKGIRGYAKNAELLDGILIIREGDLMTGPIIFIDKQNNFKAGATKAELRNGDVLLHRPYAIQVKDNSQTGLNINASQAQFINLDIDHLVNDKRLKARELKLLSTDFQFDKSRKKKDKKTSLIIEWDKVLKDNLEEIVIDEVLLNGDSLEIGIKQGQLKTRNYQIQLTGFNTNLDGRNHLLNSENLRFSTDNISFNNDKVLVKAGNFSLDRKKELITVRKFKLRNSNVDLQIPLIFGKDINLRKLAENSVIEGRELEIAGFEIDIHQNEKDDKKKTADLPEMAFQSILAHQGLIEFHTGESGIFTLNNVRWQLENFNTLKNNDRLLFADNFRIKGGTLTGFTKNKLNKIIATGLEISDAGKHFAIDHLYLQPQLPKLKYGYEVGYETDWIDMSLHGLKGTGANLEEFLQNQNQLMIQSVDAEKFNAQVYRDKKLPFPENQRPPMPQEALRRLDYKIFIDKVNVKNANVTYQELGEESYVPGELSFQNMDITLSNVTNIPSKIDKKGYMKLQVNGKIEGTPLVANVIFDLTSKDNEFTFSGRIEDSELTKFNKILEHNVFMKIEKGNSRGLTFNLKANDDYSVGTMRFLYRNLKVSVIDKETSKTTGFDESIASFFANTFVINSNNPAMFDVKEGDIYFERDKSKAIFNYWAKSFLSGVVSSIGAKSHKKEVKEALSEGDK